MSLYSWNVIATVAEHHSISQAANILNLTPSAVSHMVKKVEDGVGYALFIRERNHFELTSSGKALLPYIQNYLKSGNALVEEALRLKNSVTGSVHIAAYNLSLIHIYRSPALNQKRSPAHRWVLL